MLDYTYKPRYKDYQYVNWICEYHNGEISKETNQHCCEFVKKDVLSKKVITLTKMDDVNYSIDETNRWLTLLKENGVNIEYKIDDKKRHDSIILVYNNYYNTMHLYVSLLLVRYLWYYQNDGLIDRIFHILDNSKLNFWKALVLAHYYDNTNRDSVFNLNYNNTPITKDFIHNYNNEFSFDKTFKNSNFNNILSVNTAILNVCASISNSVIHSNTDLKLMLVFGNLVFSTIKTNINKSKTYEKAYSNINITKTIIFSPESHTELIDQYNAVIKHLGLNFTLKPSEVVEIDKSYIIPNLNLDFKGEIPLFKVVGKSTHYGLSYVKLGYGKNMNYSMQEKQINKELKFEVVYAD